MIYILIFVMASSNYPIATSTAEFNTKEACQAAADELLRQSRASRAVGAPIIFCAAKGKP